MALLYTLLTATLMAVSMFLVFSGNAGSVLRQNYAYQVRTNTNNACQVYGDLLVRSGLIDADPRTPPPAKVTVSVGCLSQSATGVCSEPITCTIEIKTDNKVYVTIN
jgi:hypothetical protein